MKAFLDSLKLVTGPLTLVAFLAVVALAMFRRSVKEERGLEFVYRLLRDKLTKGHFYELASKTLRYAFWAFVVVFLASLAAFLGDKALSRRFQGAQNNSTVIHTVGDYDLVVNGSVGGNVNVGGSEQGVRPRGNTVVAEPEKLGSSASSRGHTGDVEVTPGSGSVVISTGEGNLINTVGEGNVVITGHADSPTRRVRLRNTLFLSNSIARNDSANRIDFTARPGNSEDLRRVYGLKPVPEAHGKLFTRVHPPGSYGFFPPHLIGRFDIDGDDWSTQPAGSATIEVHKRPTGVVAVAGYVSETEARPLLNKSIDSQIELSLYDQADGSRWAVAIPQSRIEFVVLDHNLSKPPQMAAPPNTQADPNGMFKTIGQTRSEFGFDRTILIVR